MKLKENPREWQKFTLAMMAAVCLASFVMYRRHVIPKPGMLGIVAIAVIVAVFCVVRPAWFRGFYRAGMTISFQIGQVMGKIMLTVMFFAIVTPLGWVLRMTGKDFLKLKKDAHAVSYWQPVRSNSHFDRPF